MRSDLEQQLPRFADAVDRAAPAISVDEILARGTVTVDVDDLEQPAWVPRIASVAWGDTMPAGENGDGAAPIELAPTPHQPPSRRRLALKVALAIAAAAVLVVALGTIVRNGEEPEPADVPPSTVPAPPTTTLMTGAPTSGGMWPQSSIEEVRAAQVRADAGDADYTWQLDPQIVEDDTWIDEGHRVELVDRFLREVLGWEAYTLNPFEGMARSGYYDTFYDQRYLRCAPGRTNPLYPPGPEPAWGELCAPTINDVTYESVSLDLAQLDREGLDGIWVVNRWRLTGPFAQIDPEAVKAQDRLDEFLAARVAGRGAEGLVQVVRAADVPLLYADTSGASYERYEIERTALWWPYARMMFSARLFADGGATVVEHEIHWSPAEGLSLDATSTTENGRPVALSHSSADGEVTMSAPSTWGVWWPEAAHVADVGVWFGGLWRVDEFFGGGERIEFVDPVAYDVWCAANGGSPLLSAPADAAEIARQLVADPDFESTAPVAARVGGVDAVSIDVTLAPGGRACGVGMIEISRWIHGLREPGWRLRLYLVDLPEGMSVDTLAITVVAPEERFDDVIAETASIIESIEFHPG